ncbi:MAG: hypothetical protein GC151_09795 [Betaproteobacteria bacterium]|nr:hypothetical protein [Betaproteobacteria bacterium]
MTKLVAAFSALFLGLALGGVAFAADTDSQQQGQDNATNSTESQDQSTQNQSTSKDAYMAALKKCDSLGDEQKAKCVAAAKRRFGQM